MVLMSINTMEDPYENVRREVPMRPGRVIRHKKEYIKPLERRREKTEVEEGIRDYYDNVLID